MLTSKLVQDEKLRKAEITTKDCQLAYEQYESDDHYRNLGKRRLKQYAACHLILSVCTEKARVQPKIQSTGNVFFAALREVFGPAYQPGLLPRTFDDFCQARRFGSESLKGFTDRVQMLAARTMRYLLDIVSFSGCWPGNEL